MIRVNLLPQKREAARRTSSAEGSQTWMLAILGVVLLEIVGLIFFHKSKQDDLQKVVQNNQKIDANIQDIKGQISNHDAIKAQLKELRDREEAIQKLQSARTGPTSALLEVAKVMTPGRGPTVDRDKLEQLKRDNPGSVPNPNWDTRRLWLTGYQESDRKVKIVGQARDGEDVSEFLRRLTLSDYFYDVNLMPASKSIDSVTKLELIKFEFSAKVRY
ncbi:MAG: Type pilus biosis protein PilN [Myxococcaceae bacterium]|jgi:type IV pilus assembly protein PilN|nr:Type pilus biosis protein PilN [Myxococcaceae bacterium]